MKYKIAVVSLSAITAILLSFLAVKTLAGGSDRPAVVPLPQKLEQRSGSFALRPQTAIVVDPASRQTAEYLAERLRSSTGYPLPVTELTNSSPGQGSIVLTTTDARPGLGTEGYELSVTPDNVVIRAPSSAGLFYGVQSLLQLLPPEVFSAQSVSRPDWSIACVQIEDQPRFQWRGMHLDVCRHFFNKAEVKRLLDLMALHKLNTLQWHLTDDQGWRIEIKKYPRLTQVGAWRKYIGFKLDPRASTAYGPDGRYGGYYTQEDIREILAYAQARHITIIPEIELPGHASAALTAYPQLSCSGGPYSTDMAEGIVDGVYCAGNEETFTFLQDVLTEVCELFPGKNIHIGGDEVTKLNWKDCPKCQARLRQENLKTGAELQSYFIRRIEKFLSAQGRTLVGWSEIREGGLPKKAVLMDWIGGAVEAATAGYDVVMSPNTHCYFDFYQSENRAAEPRANAAYLPLNQVYSLDPIPAKLDPQYRSHILGAQANLWTEFIPSFKQVEYMAFPRLCALSEVVWSPQSVRDYEDFTRRLETHLHRLAQLGVNYRKGIPAKDQ